MKSLLTTSVLLALFTPLSLAAEKLLVITPMGSKPPVRGYAQVIDDVVGVNLTEPEAYEIEFELHPSPKGMMSSPTGPERGYLLPINNTAVHEFQFNPTPPRNNAGPTPKYKTFFATGAGCGGMCGGPQLVYDETPDDDDFGGQWLLEKREEGNEESYFIRWYNGEEAFPEGYRRCYLMREQAE